MEKKGLLQVKRGEKGDLAGRFSLQHAEGPD